MGKRSENIAVAFLLFASYYGFNAYFENERRPDLRAVWFASVHSVGDSMGAEAVTRVLKEYGAEQGRAWKAWELVVTSEFWPSASDARSATVKIELLGAPPQAQAVGVYECRRFEHCLAGTLMAHAAQEAVTKLARMTPLP